MCTDEATSLAHDVRPLDSVPGEEFGEAQGTVVFVAVVLGGGGPDQERRWITVYVKHETSRTYEACSILIKNGTKKLLFH